MEHQNKVCLNFKNASRNIWRNSKSFYENKLSVREETLTETTLLELASNLPGIFLTEKFSGQAEGENGADWEWVIIENDDCIKLRVQAKKLFIQEEAYKSLSGKVEQCKDLIRDAWETNAIPIYCFYNYVEGETLKDIVNEEPVGKWFQPDYELLGWTFAYAEGIYPIDLGVKFSSIFKSSDTISNLFCGNNLDSILKEYNDVPVPDPIKKDGSFPSLSGGSRPMIKKEKTKDLPKYVKNMISNHESGIKDHDTTPSTELVVVTYLTPVNKGFNEQKGKEANAPKPDNGPPKSDRSSTGQSFKEYNERGKPHLVR